MIGLAYGAAASRNELILVGANTMMGRNAVAATGIASVAHQTAIHKATAAVRQAMGDMKSCHWCVASITTNNNGPRKRPTIW